jgi:AraC-like DNA-binding protein
MMGIGAQAAAKTQTLGFTDPKQPNRAAGERFVPCERQRLALGEVVIERVQGLGAIVGEQAASFRVLFQRSARSMIAASGRSAELREGQWSALLDPTGSIEVERGGEVLSLSFAAGRLSRGLSDQIRSRLFAAQPIRGASRMCLELARSCLKQEEPFAATVAEALADSALELAKLALIEQFCTRGGETVRETARARIQSYIGRNLADPDLTIERIAERMQCTKRYLHKVFSDQDETLNQYIWSQRLELCRTRLLQPELANRSITEIAFDCGFSNAAHFSRSFRARFGECPRTYRRTILPR